MRATKPRDNTHTACASPNCISPSGALTFQEIVHDMDLESQRKLLMFFAGSAKAPIGGLGKLPILIQRAGPDSNQLPTR